MIGNRDLVVGFRMVGVASAEVTNTQEADAALSQAIANTEVAIIIIGEDFSIKLRERIQKHRLEKISPLILEMPEKINVLGGTRLSDLVSKNIGMRL